MRAAISFTGLASLALLSTVLTTTQAQPAAIGNSADYDAFLLQKAGMEEQILDDGQAHEGEARRAHGWNLRNHGHNHVHQHDASPASMVSGPEVTAEVEKRAATSTVLIQAPSVIATTLLGDTTNVPSSMYFWPQANQPLPTLASSLLKVDLDVEVTLATTFPMYNGSGAMVLTPDNQNQLYKLTTVPSISRDTGKGGYLSGSKLFIFADTETFTTPNLTKTGTFTGFVSNSVAVDFGFNAANGKAPALKDRVGLWTNNNGGMRGWIPWTTGEKAYNNAMNGKGGRLAIWPSSSITPLRDGVAIQYAPIVLINTTGSAVFKQIGITMYEISIPNQRSGPVAKRVAPMLFPRNCPKSWGVLGGTRSWGAQGVGGTDGWIYAWAVGSDGLYVSRVLATQAADASAYEYYWPSISGWNETMSSEVAIKGSYSQSDIFYSPMHKTFINVYADRYANSKILWRWLQVPEPIAPTYDGTDFVELTLKYPWSEQKTLVQAPIPGNGHYIYSSGPNLGYFEDDDLTNGGNKMLLTWTAPTGKGSNTLATGYAIPAAVVEWG